MKRFTHIVLVVGLLLSGRGWAEPVEQLAREFAAPPDAYRPWVFWFWVSGNVTREGITADLEAMKRVGVGGMILMNVSFGKHAGIEKPVAFGSLQWHELMQHAISECGRLGLRMVLYNSEGWSQSGGPWIKPEQSMQKLVTSAVQVNGGAKITRTLPRPEAVRGFYRDSAVIAFPTPTDDEEVARAPEAKITSNVQGLEAGKAADGDAATAVTLPAGKETWIRFDLEQPFTARAVRVVAGGFGPWRGTLQASEDGTAWRDVAAVHPPNGTFGPAEMWNNKTTAFAPTSARHFRLLMRGGDFALPVNEIELRGGARLHRWEEAAGYMVPGTVEMALPAVNVAADASVDPTRVIDLTKALKADGTLEWDAPTGKWTILRIGHTTTGAEVLPATGGLEVDKFDPGAIEYHFNTFLGKIANAAGPLTGKALYGTELDSWEQGAQNWTETFRQQFTQRRGYDPLPYLPAMTGRIVDSRDTTERFLHDLRRTYRDVLADVYYGTFRKLTSQRGMALFGEAPGVTYSVMADGFRCKGTVDVPMGEFWAADGGGNRDSREASAAGHVYGKRLIAAEAFTSTPEYDNWMSHPYRLKALGDLHYCIGINHFIIHCFAHQPFMDKFPGMSLSVFGFHFNRSNSIFEPGAAWCRYLARCQQLLQQGQFVADVCYVQREDNLVMYTDLPADKAPPAGYRFDECGEHAVVMRMSVKEGRIALPDGMSYRVLVLPETDRMTVELATKVRDLVRAGATVIGPRPARTWGLAGGAAADEQVRRIGAEVWGNCDGKTVLEHRFEQGRVIWGRSVAQVLAEVAPVADFEVIGGVASTMPFIHRSLGDAEVYFVSSQQRHAMEVECAFRVTGRAPELWYADSGRIEPAAQWREEKGRTIVPIRFEPAGSVFVVFRRPKAGADPVIAVMRNGAPVGPAQRGKAVVVVRKARYGLLHDPQRTRDVTERVQKMVGAGQWSFRVADLARDGDPAYLFVKTVEVDCTVDGRPVLATAVDTDTIDLQTPGSALPVVEVKGAGEKGTAVYAWESGEYELKYASGRHERLKVEVPGSMAVEGPWQVRFQPGRGAPQAITLDKLVDWSQHPEDGVKFFGGTAEYRKTIEIPADRLSGSRRLWLDLGEVAVMARVEVNGKDLGVLWKPPYRVDITDAAKPGANTLSVRVTNVLANRIIGDQQAPAEKRLTWSIHQPFNAKSPLQKSGLMGPVMLRSVQVDARAEARGAR